MKKLTIFLAIGFLLAIPIVANASLLGTGELHVSASGPNVEYAPDQYYYGDYDGSVVLSDFGYTTGLEEIFCVSEDPGHSTETVDFYTIDSDLLNYAALSKASWIADNWDSLGYGNSDSVKVEAQKAVWVIMGVIDFSALGSGAGSNIYNAALSVSNYITNNWYYAQSPGGNTTLDYQDYLTPVSPVPEPATMLLFGVGLCGLAFVGRKKLIKQG